MPCVSWTDFHTTNLVDVNWTITVIIKHRRPPKLSMTPHIPPPAHHRKHGPPWRMDKFLAVKRLSRRLLDRSKNTIFTYPTCIWRLVGLIPLELRSDLLHRETKRPWLSCGVVCMVLRLAILVQFRLVTDRQTDTRWQQTPQKHSG